MVNMAKSYIHEIPEGYEARIEGNKVIIELAESEDEMIRKGLVNFLQSPFIKENLTDEKVAPWIAYLEKQKEQKPAEWSEEDGMETINVFRPLAGTSIESATKQAVNKFTNSRKKFLLAFNGVFLLIDNTKSVQDIVSEYNRSLGGKKKEQEQSEGEPNDFEITLNDCMLAAQQYPPGKIGWDNVKMWAEELSNYCPQPNQKWSEFDRHCLERAIWYVENPAPNVVKDTNLVLWLKSLPLNLKKRNEDVAKLCSNEWSEENEKIIDSILDILRANGYHSHASYLNNLLKSLRPQPKQEWSKEEKEVLDSIIDDYEKANKSFCGYDGKIGLLRAIRDGEYNLPKPAEWSEEDEKMRQGCIDSVEYELLDNGRDDEVETDPRIVWLKSLRPQPQNDERVRYCIEYVNPRFPLLSDGQLNIRHLRVPDEHGAEMAITIILSFGGKIYALYRGNLKDGRLGEWPTPMIVDKEDWYTREWLDELKKHDGFSPKSVAIDFINYLDANRPEGKMCLSNGECEDIEKAFTELDWAKIIRYYEKYGRRD